MSFIKYFTKNNAQGIVIDDTSSSITFEAGHSFPSDVTQGPFLITLNPPNGEIVKVTAASEDGSGVLTLTVTRAQESSSYTDHTSGTMGYMLFTAGQYNSITSQLEDIYDGSAQISALDVTGNIIVGGTVDGRNISTDGTKLDGIESGAEVNTVDSVNGLTGTITLVTGNISDTTSTQKYATAAQLAKIDYISITQAVNLDTLESDTTANNAKVTNANHTGDVTGADVLGIVPAAISGKTSVTPVSGDYLLLWDATDSALKKADASNFLSGAVSSVNGQTGSVTLVTGNISDTTSTQKYVTSADITKLGYISITQAVNLDTMESDIATNNAKVSNADHTGDVTGSVGLTIVPSAISGKTGVTPVAGDYVLLWDATDSLLKKANVDSFLSGGGGGSGDVVGPSIANDRGIPVFDGTGGKNIIDTGVTITLSDDIENIQNLWALESITLGRGDRIAEASFYLWTDNSGVRKNIQFMDNSATKWALGEDTDFNFKLDRYVSGSYTDSPLVIDSTSGDITLTGYINGISISGGDIYSSHIHTDYSIYLGTNAIASTVSLNFATDTSNDQLIRFQEGSVYTWNMGVYADLSFKIDRYDVFGDYLDTPFSISKSTGNITTSGTINGRTLSTDGAKLDFISVTQAVNLDTMESDIATNNAKVTNANHTGDVTGSGILGIVSAAITGKSLVTAAGGDSILISDVSDSGNLKKALLSDIANVNHTGDVTGADVLGIVPAAISGKTAVTPATGDYVLLWDATDSTLKKSLVDTFINGTYGDVTGAASSTDNAIAIFNGTGGKTIKNTSVTIADTSSITIPGFLTVTGQARNSEQTALSTSGIVTWNINNNPIANILLAGDVTSFTISGINLNSNATLYIKQHASSAKTISWPGTITWAGGYAPSLTTLGSKHVISMYSYDGTGLIASAVSDSVLTAISNSGGTTLANAVAIFDSTTGTAIKDGTGCLDISGNFTNILSINGTTWATLVSDVSTNNAKVSNATHTGEVTGSTALVIDPTAISGKTAVTPVAGDYLLLWDATDSALKKVDATNFLGGGSVSSVNGQTGAVTLVTGNISDTTSTQKYVTAADITKLGYISVTQAVDLDTMESDIATNNAKVTNANHTGDVTGSSALTIVASAISGKTGVTAEAGDYVLLWDATDSSLKKADVTTFISTVTASSTTTFTNKRITKRVATLTDATGIVFNSDSYDIGKVTLGGNRTLNNFTGTPTDGQPAQIIFIQDATGSRTITLDTTGAGGFRFGTDVTGITLSTTAGKRDLAMFQYSSDKTGWLVLAFAKGY